MPEEDENSEERNKFMFYTALLDQGYWVAGSVLGAVAGTFIPFDMNGVSFALTALFIELMIEQILRIKKILPFAIFILVTITVTLLFPGRYSLLSAMIISLGLVQIFSRIGRQAPC